jgi:alanine-synthesizing transaminase
MKFSERTRWNTDESELARAHRLRLEAVAPVADLTASNPTRCGFTYDPDLLGELAAREVFDYDPNPKGSLRARDAVCRYYADHAVRVDPGQIILTTSTSEAYSYLFKLLCDPGDQILVPQPSYPLFDFLADAEVITLAFTPLVYDYGWQLDLAALRRQITPRTRAIVLVHPNNPTGHFTTVEQARELAAICREAGLALIVDEVFLDYPIGDETLAESHFSFAGLGLDILVFVVSGISKIAGLPQMKAAWLLASGPGSDEAMHRLEVLADTYLSMNAPVQRAFPGWLAGRRHVQDQIRSRVQTNLAELDRQLSLQSLVSRLAVDGGWYVILRIPVLKPDHDTALELLTAGVWVHPGYFFGMPPSGWLVVSLLTPASEFSTGMEIVLSHPGEESSQLP